MKHFTFLVCLILILAACKKGELKIPVTGKPCADTLQHDVVSVSGPTSASAEQQIIFNVTWKGYNACDNFTSFKQDTLANVVIVKAFAVQDSCSVCALTTSNFKTTAYKFRPDKSGIYYIKFIKSANSSTTAITDTLIVK